MLTKEDLGQIKEVVTEIVTKSETSLRTSFRAEFKQDIAELRQEIGDDISRLVMVMATKDELQEVRNDLTEMRTEFREFLLRQDKTIGALADLQLEYADVSVQQGRQVQWNHKVGKEVGIPYEY